jgi:hypothetical protein
VHPAAVDERHHDHDHHDRPGADERDPTTVERHVDHDHHDNHHDDDSALLSVGVAA